MTPGATDEPVAVISGAASGIGASCAGLMRRSGWRTAGIDLNPSDTDLSLRADVSDRAAVASADDIPVEAKVRPRHRFRGRERSPVGAVGQITRLPQVLDESTDHALHRMFLAVSR